MIRRTFLVLTLAMVMASSREAGDIDQLDCGRFDECGERQHHQDRCLRSVHQWFFSANVRARLGSRWGGCGAELAAPILRVVWTNNRT